MSDFTDVRKWLGAKPNQKVLLIEAHDQKDFSKAFLAIRKFCAFPIEGSMHERPVCVRIPGCEGTFFPVSINGNLGAWEAGITEMCRATRRELAWIEGGTIIFSSGRQVATSEITVTELPS
jgi:hypothetical protein